MNYTNFDGLISQEAHEKAFPRSVTIVAAVCAIIFSIVGVIGEIKKFFI